MSKALRYCFSQCPNGKTVVQKFQNTIITKKIVSRHRQNKIILQFTVKQIETFLFSLGLQNSYKI